MTFNILTSSFSKPFFMSLFNFLSMTPGPPLEHRVHVSENTPRIPPQQDASVITQHKGTNRVTSAISRSTVCAGSRLHFVPGGVLTEPLSESPSIVLLPNKRNPDIIETGSNQA